MRFANRFAWVSGVAATGSLALATLGGTGAGAAQVPGITISPSAPAPGETVTVSGVCYGVDPDTGQKVKGDRVDVFLLDHEVESPPDAYSEFMQKASATPAADYTWSATFQVPEDATTDEQFFIVDQCLHRFSGFYQSGSFGVGLPPSSSSTTAPPAGTPGTPGTPGGGDGGSGSGSGSGTGASGGRGPSASPVSGRPTYTG